MAGVVRRLRAYAAWRAGAVVRRGDLDDTIQALVTGDEAEVGTNVVYGAIHQFGGEEVGLPGLPARPYLGLSAEDEADLDAIIDDWASQVMGS